MHRALVTMRSSFFKEALQVGTRKVTLEDTTPFTFERYLQYLYTRRIPCIYDTTTDSKEEAELLIDLYLLAL